MRLIDLHEVRYHIHPVFNWIKKKIAKNRSLSDALILSDRQYEELGKILPKEFGEPNRRQDGMHWILRDKDRRFYLDLQKLFGPEIGSSGRPEYKTRKLTISSID